MMRIQFNYSQLKLLSKARFHWAFFLERLPGRLIIRIIVIAGVEINDFNSSLSPLLDDNYRFILQYCLAKLALFSSHFFDIDLKFSGEFLEIQSIKPLMKLTQLD